MKVPIFCYKCDYKAKFSQTKQQKEFIHEDVRYSCGSIDGNAAHQSSQKTNKESNLGQICW